MCENNKRKNVNNLKWKYCTSLVRLHLVFVIFRDFHSGKSSHFLFLRIALQRNVNKQARMQINNTLLFYNLFVSLSASTGALTRN